MPKSTPTVLKNNLLVIQDLLRTALGVEERRARAAEKLERRLQLAKLTHEEREKVWREEMSEGIPGETARRHPDGTEEEEEEGREMEETGGAAQGIRKRPIRAEERKTKKQRRRELLRRKEVSIIQVEPRNRNQDTLFMAQLC